MRTLFATINAFGQHAPCAATPTGARHIRTVNELAVTNFLIGLPFLFFFLFIHRSGHAAIVGGILSGFAAAPLLNRAHRANLARLCLLLPGTAALVLYAALLGRSSGIQMMLFTNVCLPLIVVERRTAPALFFGGLALPIVGWLWLEVTDYSALPRYTVMPSTLRYLYLAIFPMTLLGMLNNVILFFRSFNESQRQLEVLHGRLFSELNVARALQARLLPTALISPNLELAASMRPTAAVGGDYYDLIEMPHATWLAIGDVSGHGVTSGMIALMIRTSLRAAILTRPNASPSEILAAVNESVYPLLERIGPHEYMTMTVLRCSANGDITFAGRHQDLLVYRAPTQTVEAVPSSGMWVGIMPDISAFTNDEHLTLDAGDRLLLYTDGVTEARAFGQIIAADQLAKWFTRACLASMNPTTILEALRRDVSPLEEADDQTLMVVAPRNGRVSATRAITA